MAILYNFLTRLSTKFLSVDIEKFDTMCYIIQTARKSRRFILLLVIGKTKSDANSVSDIFNYMGIVSYGTTPELSATEFSNRHRAILFIHPEEMSTVSEVVSTARTYSLNTPIFAIFKSTEGAEEKSLVPYSLFDEVFSDSMASSDILYGMIAYQLERGRLQLGTYRFAGIDASINCGGVYCFDKEVSLTKTEAMILRFLMLSYPIRKSASDILRYAFRSGKLAEPSSIRAHICSINAKLIALFGRRTIKSDRGAGYYIDVGEK